jgi:hypothetical protein
MDVDTLIAQLQPALNLITDDNSAPIVAVRQLRPIERRTEYDIILQVSTEPMIHPGGRTLPSDRITAVVWHPGISNQTIRLSLTVRSKDGADQRMFTFSFLGSKADIMNSIVVAQDAGVWQPALIEVAA